MPKKEKKNKEKSKGDVHSRVDRMIEEFENRIREIGQMAGEINEIADKRAATCFAHWCGMTPEGPDKTKVVECLSGCPISMQCMSATQMWIMMTVKRDTGRGEEWRKGHEENPNWPPDGLGEDLG